MGAALKHTSKTAPVRDVLVNIFSVLGKMQSANKRQPALPDCIGWSWVHKSCEEFASDI